MKRPKARQDSPELRLIEHMIVSGKVLDALRIGYEAGSAWALTVPELTLMGRRCVVTLEFPDGEPEGWRAIAAWQVARHQAEKAVVSP